jgi:hypothetical protein
MMRAIGLFSAVAVGFIVASSGADAQTVRHRAHHRPIQSPAGHDVTVHAGVAPWLTLGTWAPVGSRNGYALDTLRPPERNTIQGTFSGMRGNDRLPNDVSLPQANRPLITVSSPGLGGPLFDWY